MFQRTKEITSQPQQSEQVSTEIESDTHQRVAHVMSNILDTIPEGMRDHPMARMLKTFAKEGMKDLKKIPPEFIENLSNEMGNAFLWVAHGKMSDLNANEVPDLPEQSATGDVPDMQEAN
jgi:hypothetical protein